MNNRDLERRTKVADAVRDTFHCENFAALRRKVAWLDYRVK